MDIIFIIIVFLIVSAFLITAGIIVRNIMANIMIKNKIGNWWYCYGKVNHLFSYHFFREFVEEGNFTPKQKERYLLLSKIVKFIDLAIVVPFAILMVILLIKTDFISVLHEAFS